MKDPTTLQIARRIATAVLRAGHQRRRDSTRDAPTQAVLRVLDETDTWFSRHYERRGLTQERRLR